ncbi:hypothetical protein OG218_09025 [Kineococcus sp. NBC_00420]|uniref:hypothetical protein n=1 Tax=unclassified Kineococcus TaxID=2621656 RepID=UPI002E1B6F22
MRRIRRPNLAAAAAGQGESFGTYRYHAVFTDSPLSMVEAEKDHRAHAVIESVISDVEGGR